MTPDSEAFNIIHHFLDQYALFESTATVPVNELIAALEVVERRRPGSDVTAGMLRAVLFDVQDNIIGEIRRKKTHI